ncbi:MAG: response regulator transcription factor [Gaiellaceae bacterium]
MIVDDDEGVRTLVSDLLELAGYETVTAESGEIALREARREKPWVVVLDVKMPGLSGYAVCDELRKLYGNAVAIILISGERVESYDRVAGFLVGADDYVVKPFDPDELLGRIRVALHRIDSSERVPWPLTPREQEVLRLLAEGLEQAEIADRLVISTKTVATHIERVLGKLGVRSRAQAVAFAYREGLVSIPA